MRKLSLFLAVVLLSCTMFATHAFARAASSPNFQEQVSQSKTFSNQAFSFQVPLALGDLHQDDDFVDNLPFVLFAVDDVEEDGVFCMQIPRTFTVPGVGAVTLDNLFILFSELADAMDMDSDNYTQPSYDNALGAYKIAQVIDDDGVPAYAEFVLMQTDGAFYLFVSRFANPLSATDRDMIAAIPNSLVEHSVVEGDDFLSVLDIL